MMITNQNVSLCLNLGILRSLCVGPYDILVNARRVPFSLSDTVLHQGTASGKLGMGWISSLPHLCGESPLYWAQSAQPCVVALSAPFLTLLPSQWGQEVP